jgi:hypothetical protein
MANARTIYLITRRVTAGRYGVGLRGDQKGGPPVLACATAEAAEHRRQELEEEARRVMCPFGLDDAKRWSSRGLTGLIAHLEALGLRDLPPPLTDWRAPARWRHWWDRHAPELTPEQRRGVWEALDQVHFYQVTRVKLKS